MDNRAENHYFGANFRPISFALEEYTVYLLLSEYIEQANIPIRTGVTELTLDLEEVVILEFGHCLWFGNRMEKSLIT